MRESGTGTGGAEGGLREALSGQLLSLAFAAARQRELLQAVRLSRMALALGAPCAAELLGLCLYARGEIDAALEALPADSALRARLLPDIEAERTLRRAVGAHIESRRFRKARGALRGEPGPWALKVTGCLYARAKRFRRAADCFGAALEMDKGDAQAAALLLACVSGRRRG